MYSDVTTLDAHPTNPAGESLITVAAGDIEHGDLVHYNAALAWRVEGTNLFGKSIDIDFKVERSELEPALVGAAGDHRFRQSTNVLVLRKLSTTDTAPAPVTVPAGDLVVGDVVHYNAAQSWLVNGLNLFGKSVDVDFRFEAHELEPATVGTTGAHRFRQSTNLLVTRAR